ncbi:PaaI family thioesterase [Pseudonocardia sp. WMMC193]|uniref:PaaI family thioesterase n=1 Tax=Pseudonocardia sp. WMMC193 TaxID=2911965 RepID=UPI001F348116|nr:PaaI family thioesterase [Pseudonocardia sp. WMMC193]MCF7548763.1 PaaI family thioesterase [Pseudonocardia sp. WMMC193]
MSTPDTDLDAQSGLSLLWADRDAAPPEVPAGFLTMVETMRELQDRLTAAAPPAEVVAEMTEALRGVADRLGEYEVDERKQLAGHLRHLPGRGQALIPPLVLTHEDTLTSRGHVRFGRFYLGANGAVHGGALPLMFDDLLGRLANTGDRVPARTAYLRVDYRSITPIDRELQVRGWFDREEGRKRYLRGTIHAGDVLCAEADALFVALRPGQP